MKLVVALAALLCAAPSVPQEVADFAHDETAIVLLTCFRDTGRVTGTAFKVSETGYISANHVVTGGTCYIAGQRAEITSTDVKRDYATLTGPASPAMLRTSCEGFKPGQVYAARGYPGGGAYNIFSPMLATTKRMSGFHVFIGADVIPGQSGGPALDGEGRVVGVVVMRFPNRAMPLQSTGYCKA